METSIATADFAKVMACLDIVVDKKASNPIMSGVLIDGTKHDRMEIAATDGNITLRARMPASDHAGANHVIDASKLSAIIKSAKKIDMLDLAFKKSSIKVSGGSFSFDMPSLDGADFPQYTPPEPSEHTIKVRADEFASILGRTAFAAASNDLRYYLNGVYLLISDSTINATATNSHRLSHESCSGHDGTNGSSIVPVKTVKVLQKIIEMICKDQAITISIYPTLITFEADTWMLESRVIDGKYPDVSTVLSVKHPNKIIINAELLSKEIKRAEIIAASSVNLNFDTENRAIKINCSNNDEGSFISKIDIIDGDATSKPAEADYNPAYLAEILDIIEGPQCSLQYADEAHKGQLIIKDIMRPLWTGILMPVRR